MNTGLVKMMKQRTAMEGVKDTKTIHTLGPGITICPLQDENLIPEQEFPAKNKLVYYLIRIAAVALILLGTIAVVYINMNRKPAVAMVKLNTGNETATLIKTLADGSVIYLAQNSLFSFPEEFKSASRNVELNGEAFFDIIPILINLLSLKLTKR